MLLNLQLYRNLIQYLLMYSSKAFVQKKKKKKKRRSVADRDGGTRPVETNGVFSESAGGCRTLVVF